MLLTSNIRAKITEELITSRKVKNIIFEKVLFQSLEEYNTISELLNKYQINAWVNCAKRMFKYYNNIKEILKGQKNITLTVEGNEWGMGSNSVHFIDLICFLGGESKIIETNNFLNPELLKSKRDGYYEITGSLRFYFENGNELIIHSRVGSYPFYLININTQSNHIIIDETKNFAKITSENNGWIWEDLNIEPEYQSNLTNIAAKDILINNTCTLPSFELSKEHHLHFLKTVSIV